MSERSASFAVTTCSGGALQRKVERFHFCLREKTWKRRNICAIILSKEGEERGMSLGKKLSGYRRDAGYTQQQLGDLLNVSAQAVSKWENDQAEPDLQMLRRLCLIYKIKMDDLFDEESAATERAPQAESAAPAGRAGSAEEKAPPSSVPAERKPLGHCVSCGKAVYKGNAARTVAGLYCRQCYQLYTAGLIY